ncbi:phosphoglycerate dehydrogenase [Anaerobacillus alkaliphilus]|uniref:D-3-phosphoglycerate dehydrogenase n=1 Tax=Anaerobacillus alkaliphilus TaxID=1548597 RepID=A0A4Q0VXK0_9BACI|nr:phosphoglycerate dehydrogenase [Anaerobacillus alkaliphilus]RXJ03896.1 phosphoglycerate dehydrogenase [Anaerobacillus alkaliphilus]
MIRRVEFVVQALSQTEKVFTVLVSDSMSKEGLLPLLESDKIICLQKTIEEAQNQLDQVDALLIRSATKVTTELLDKMPNVKIIARAGVGVDNVDIQAATKKGIIVVNAPDGNTISTAEHSFAMIAALLRKIPQANTSTKNGEWTRKKFQGTELFGKSLGIVGFGRIGSEIAKRAKAFQMSIYVFDPFLTKERAEKFGVTVSSLDDVLAQADIITVHTPLTNETKGLLNFDTIAKTKKGVFLINCARGGIIDEEALIYYLQNGHVAGAALDVFEEEPATNTRLLDFEQVIATPHIAASTIEAQLNVASQVSEEVLNYFEGKPVLNSINLPTISKEVYKKIQPYYELAKSMGSILSQCMRTPVNEIEVNYGGEVTTLETSITTRSLLAGFLQPRVDAPVNDVNASIIAKERGITFGEKHINSSSGYSNVISASVIGEDRTFNLKGTYVKEYGPRIIRINEFKVDFTPSGHLIYIEHIDKPGMIGLVGQLLGKHEINIGSMQVGRKEEGGKALMMLSIDKPLTESVLRELVSSEHILYVNKIDLT